MDFRIFCFLLFCVHNGAADMMAKNSNNYGPYTVEWEHFDCCPSTKSVIVSNSTSALIKHPDNTFSGWLNTTLFENVKLEEIKMAVYTMKDGKKTQLWNYIVNKPCQHYMLAAMLETYFQAKNCLIKKGPYTVEWEHFDTCPSTKPIIMSNATSILIKEPNNTYRGWLNVTLFDNAKVEEIKMAVYAMKDGKKTQLWNYIINKPCQHYMLAAMFETYYNAKNCVLKKGMHFVDFPLTSLMVKYLGDSFFYGDYIFKVAVNTKHSNICCLLFDPKFKKKITR